MTHTIAAESTRSGVTESLARLSDYFTARGVAGELAGELRLVSEEVLTNIQKYAAASTFEVRVAIQTDEIALEFRDPGRRFNPLDQPEPDVDRPLAVRPEGGLGILLVKRLADHMSYQREAETNVLRVVKKR